MFAWSFLAFGISTFGNFGFGWIEKHVPNVDSFWEWCLAFDIFRFSNIYLDEECVLWRMCGFNIYWQLTNLRWIREGLVDTYRWDACLRKRHRCVQLMATAWHRFWRRTAEIDKKMIVIFWYYNLTLRC